MNPKTYGFALHEPVQKIMQDIMAFKKIKKPEVIRVSIEFLNKEYDLNKIKVLEDCHLLLSMRGFWDFFPELVPTINYTVRLDGQTTEYLEDLASKLKISKTFVVIYAICAYWLEECKDEKFSATVSENVEKIAKLLNI